MPQADGRRKRVFASHENLKNYNKSLKLKFMTIKSTF